MQGITKTMENIERKVNINQNKITEEVEIRMDQERREQDKRMEKFMMMQDKKFQEEMKRISVDTGMMMAKYIADTRETIREESQKVSRQLAQNALDLEGIRKRMYTMDMDLQATGEVAASTSGYLA